MLIYLVSIFSLSFILLSYLYKLKESPTSKVKNLLIVHSGKSSSGALLLGGLPVGLSVTLGIAGVSFVYPDLALPWQVISTFFFCGSLLIFYGMMDDKYELRPIVKLFCQFLSVFAFSIISAVTVGGNFSTIVFMALCFYGMGTLNGTNLLDGLDLMTVKLSSIAYLSYFLMAYLLGNNSTMLYSAISFSGLIAFTVYNKFPSKIHLGEIGGAFIGFSYLFLSVSNFNFLQNRMSFVDALSLSLLPVSISMVEVGVSFCRRIFNSKSPFKGDRFHVHHILRNYYGYSVTKTTNILSFFYGSALGIAILSNHYLSLKPMLAYLLTLICMCVFQFSVGKKFWIKKSFDFSLKNFLTSLRKEHLVMIDSSKVDKFEFKIIQGGKSVSTEETDEKKAA